jgi:hypothetical protein
VYTRDIRYKLNHYGLFEWSAPRDLRSGDLALLYEIGKPDDKKDLRDRKQIGWPLRAISDAFPDPEERWGWVAKFEGVAIPRTLRYRKPRRVVVLRGSGRTCRGGHRRLVPPVWRDLVRLVGKGNRALAEGLKNRPTGSSGGPELGRDFDRARSADSPGPGRLWRSEF